MQLKDNSLTNSNFVKTLNKVYSADYAYEKVCTLRKTLPKLDREKRLLFRGIVSHLESHSIDAHDEFWNRFKQKAIEQNKDSGVLVLESSPENNRGKRRRKCQLRELFKKYNYD